MCSCTKGLKTTLQLFCFCNSSFLVGETVLVLRNSRERPHTSAPSSHCSTFIRNRKPNRNGAFDGSLLIWLVTKNVNESRAFRHSFVSKSVLPLSRAQSIMSANALPATIVALGAAGMSYCMLPHLDILFFLCPARHHVLYTFSRLLLQSQGTYPQFRSANWRALNPRDTSR